MAENEEYYPEKIVIMNGPSLSTSLKLIALGAALGSAGTLYWLRRNKHKAQDSEYQKERVKNLFSRAVTLALQAGEMAKSTFPQWQDAVDAAKMTATETEIQLHHQLENESSD